MFDPKHSSMHKDHHRMTTAGIGSALPMATRL
jgi:hypothetical protein